MSRQGRRGHHAQRFVSRRGSDGWVELPRRGGRQDSTAADRRCALAHSLPGPVTVDATRVRRCSGIAAAPQGSTRVRRSANPQGPACVRCALPEPGGSAAPCSSATRSGPGRRDPDGRRARPSGRTPPIAHRGTDALREWTNVGHNSSRCTDPDRRDQHDARPTFGCPRSVRRQDRAGRRAQWGDVGREMTRISTWPPDVLNLRILDQRRPNSSALGNVGDG